MVALNYKKIQEFWDQAKPSSLSPYMMEGYGFPESASKYRFKAEAKILKCLLESVDRNGTVLDLGGGVGLWTSFFAERFRHVITVEASPRFYKALEERRSLHPNIQIFQQDVRSFVPQTPISLAFSGGLLMYLNDEDIRNLLKRLRGDLKPGGIMVCRETTIRNGAVIRQGNYQAVYRSVSVYKKIFEEAGFQVLKIEKNSPYVLLEMGIQFLEKLKEMIPYPKRWISILGPCVYFGLRLSNRWIVKMPRWLGMEYPELQNHFFAIRPY